MSEQAIQVLFTLVITAGALALVAWPIIHRRTGRPVVRPDDARLEARIAEYRAALARGGVCERCLYPNPEGARYCASCGREATA